MSIRDQPSFGSIERWNLIDYFDPAGADTKAQLAQPASIIFMPTDTKNCTRVAPKVDDQWLNDPFLTYNEATKTWSGWFLANG